MGPDGWNTDHSGEQEGLHTEIDYISQGIAPPEGKYRPFPRIKAIFADVDGVLTNGGFYYSKNGLAMKKFCTRDAAAVYRLRQAGYLVFAVTHSDDDITTLRLRDMKFDGYYIGVEDKVESIKAICDEFNLDMSKGAIYIEDDVGGIPAMKAVAVSFCPADAAPSVLEQGRVCQAKGGEGVLAEVADLILRE